MIETKEKDPKEDLELTNFKIDCRELEPDVVVQKHLIDGSSCFFDLYYDGNEEFIFKKAIASSLDVHIRDVAVVGSGKLGFSIKPNDDILRLYEFKLFDHEYKLDGNNKKSDLDVAIVSSHLFDDQLKSLYEHTDCYINTVFSTSKRNAFAKYVLKGWVRPDMLPDGYEISPNIKSVQSDLSDKYGREVNVGIYKSWYFFEKYHQNNIYSLSLNLIA